MEASILDSFSNAPNSCNTKHTGDRAVQMTLFTVTHRLVSCLNDTSYKNAQIGEMSKMTLMNFLFFFNTLSWSVDTLLTLNNYSTTISWSDNTLSMLCNIQIWDTLLPYQ